MTDQPPNRGYADAAVSDASDNSTTGPSLRKIAHMVRSANQLDYLRARRGEEPLHHAIRIADSLREGGADFVPPTVAAFVSALLRDAPRTVPYEVLALRVSNVTGGEVYTDTLRSYAKRTREVLRAARPSGLTLKNASGFGYRLEATK